MLLFIFLRLFVLKRSLSVLFRETFYYLFLRVHALFQLCSELSPKEVEPGVAISSLSGVLVTRDNKMTLNSYTSKKSYVMQICVTMLSVLQICVTGLSFQHTQIISIL